MTEPKITRVKKPIAPLIIEPHPRDYNGLPFITLVQYRKQSMLVVVDNMDNDTLKSYVLDLCGPEGIKEELFLSVVSEWYDCNRQSYPVSIEFSRRGMAKLITNIYRTISVEFITRIIGPIYTFPVNNVRSIKRRRRKNLSDGIEISED